MSGEKRAQDQEETSLSQTVILVDIEGTTTSISFVKETLFPYVKEHLSKYIEDKWAEEEFKDVFKSLKDQAKEDEEKKLDGFIPITDATKEEAKESLVKNVLWQMDNDRKTGALKKLQGQMWREAYKSGTVKGHVYDDVPKAFDSWVNDGKKIYVYSSGSVEAQKLLFENSVHGDMSKYFSGYYDTEVGLKQEAVSYRNILKNIEVDSSKVVFLTDMIKEADAAKEAGILSIISIREGNSVLTDEEKTRFTTIKSFLDLSFQTSAKRQKLDKETDEKKTETVRENPVQPMDTSEDAEREKQTEKKMETKKPEEDEKMDETKDASPETTKTSVVKKDDPDLVSKSEKPDESKEKPDTCPIKPIEKEKKDETKVSDKKSIKIDEAKESEKMEEIIDKSVPEKETVSNDAKKDTTELSDSNKKEKLEDKESDKIQNGDVPILEKSEDKEKIEPEVKEKTDEKIEPTKEDVAEVSKQETKSSEEVKENQTPVQHEKKTLNGTTENGDSSAKDDELHRNGVEESKAKEEKIVPQNGDPDNKSAESIKVKKVDAGGEPEVVPPVVVAATS